MSTLTRDELWALIDALDNIELEDDQEEDEPCDE